MNKESNASLSFLDEFEYVTRIFKNWFIVAKHCENMLLMSIVDSNNRVLLPLDNCFIFADENMIFVNGFNDKKSFVWDSNGNYILSPQNDIHFTITDNNGVPKTGFNIKNKLYFSNQNKIVVYSIKGENNFQFHLFCPGLQPSLETPCFAKIERVNDTLYKTYNAIRPILDDREKFVLINKYGKYVFNQGEYSAYQTFDTIKEINGVFYLRMNTYYGYGDTRFDAAIDKNGHILANLTDYDYITPVQEGYVLVHKDRSYGLLNSDFSLEVPLKYSNLEFVESGVLRYEHSYLCDYNEIALVSKDGNYIKLPKDYCRASEFTKGFYVVHRKSDSEEWRTSCFNMPCGLIDEIGNIIISFKYSKLEPLNWQGKEYIRFWKDEKAGIMDFSENVLIEGEYDYIESEYLGVHKSDIVLTMWKEENEVQKLYGLIGPDFKEILPPVHQVLRFPKDGIIVFMFNNIWGFHSLDDKTNRIVHGYSYLRNYSDGLCCVNQGGELVWHENEEDTYTEINGELIIGRHCTVKGGLWGAIDKNGQLVLPCKYDMLLPFENGTAIVREGSKRGIINSEGKCVVPIIYDDVEKIWNDVSIVTIDEKKGFVTTSGITVDCKYTEIIPFGINNVTPFKDNNSWGLISKTGGIVIEAEYFDIIETHEHTYHCVLDESELEYDDIDCNGVVISSVRIEEEKHDDDELSWILERDEDGRVTINFDYDEDLPY